MSAQLQAARERGRRDGLILLARLRHNILFDTLQRGADSMAGLGVGQSSQMARSAASNLGPRLPLGTTGDRTSYEAK